MSNRTWYPIRILMPVVVVLGLGNCEGSNDCDEALAVVCSCASKPCDLPTPPSVVEKLRDCSSHGCTPDDPGTPICITESGASYCAILDMLQGASSAACDMECTHENACDLRQACLEHQWKVCGVVEPDAGAKDGN